MDYLMGVRSESQQHWQSILLHLHHVVYSGTLGEVKSYLQSHYSHITIATLHTSPRFDSEKFTDQSFQLKFSVCYPNLENRTIRNEIV